jgi:hypothetical protein
VPCAQDFLDGPNGLHLIAHGATYGRGKSYIIEASIFRDLGADGYNMAINLAKVGHWLRRLCAELNRGMTDKSSADCYYCIFTHEW